MGGGRQTSKRKSPACSPLHAGLSRNGRGYLANDQTEIKMFLGSGSKETARTRPNFCPTLIPTSFQTTSMDWKSNDRANSCNTLFKAESSQKQGGFRLQPMSVLRSGHNIVYDAHDIGQGLIVRSDDRHPCCDPPSANNVVYRCGTKPGVHLRTLRRRKLD